MSPFRFGTYFFFRWGPGRTGGDGSVLGATVGTSWATRHGNQRRGGVPQRTGRRRGGGDDWDPPHGGGGCGSPPNRNSNSRSYPFRTPPPAVANRDDAERLHLQRTHAPAGELETGANRETSLEGSQRGRGLNDEVPITENR